MSNVVDLLTRRATRGQTVLRFDGPTDALDFAVRQVRELQDHLERHLLLTAEELDLRLAQLAAVLIECRHVCDTPTPRETHR